MKQVFSKIKKYFKKEEPKVETEREKRKKIAIGILNDLENGDERSAKRMYDFLNMAIKNNLKLLSVND